MTEKLIFPNATNLAEAAASLVVADLKETIAAHGQATWVVAGGTAPMAAYNLLAANAVDALDWSRVNIVIGDERCVPYDSPDASWSQIDAALFQKVKVSELTARPPTRSDAEQAAELYEEYLNGLPQTDGGLPQFDHVWLGVGEDGHTLSLFPNHPSFADGSDSSDRLVIPVHDSPKPPPDRISLTLRALRGVKHCVIITAGAGKAEAIGRAFAGDLSLPVAKAAAVVEQAGGSVTWLLDEAAASQIGTGRT